MRRAGGKCDRIRWRTKLDSVLDCFHDRGVRDWMDGVSITDRSPLLPCLPLSLSCTSACGASLVWCALVKQCVDSPTQSPIGNSCTFSLSLTQVLLTLTCTVWRRLLRKRGGERERERERERGASKGESRGRRRERERSVCVFMPVRCLSTGAAVLFSVYFVKTDKKPNVVSSLINV